jgi:MFS family permease
VNRLLLEGAPPATPATERHRSGSVAIVSAGMFLVLLTFCGPLADMPVIASALGAGADEQTWLLSSMSVGLAATLLTAGSLADNIGRRRMFVGGSILFALGTLLCAVAADPVIYLAGRVLGGAAAAAIISASLGIIAHVSPTPAARAKASGMWGASLGAGGAVGPLFAGLLDEVHLWRVLYVVTATLTFAVAWWGHKRVEESSAAIRRPIDLAGAATLTTAVVLGLIGLTEARSGLSSRVVGYGAVAAALLVAFVVVELRRKAPMIDLRLFLDQGFVAVTVGALGTGLGVIGVLSFACTFFMTGLGMSSLHAAALLLAWSGMGTISALAARRLPPALRGSRQLVIGLLVAAIGELALVDRVTSAGWGLLPGLLVIGVAYGVLNAALGQQAIASVPAAQAAMGSGANNTARYIGAAIGVTLVVIVARQADGSTEAAWNHAVGLSAVLCAFAGLVVAAVSLRRRPEVREAV